MRGTNISSEHSGIGGKIRRTTFSYSTIFKSGTVCLLTISVNHGKTDVDSHPLADAMLQSARSQEQKLLIERPLLLKIACISSKQVHMKRILLVSPF